jgi:hypothetical protein
MMSGEAEKAPPPRPFGVSPSACRRKMPEKFDMAVILSQKIVCGQI